MCKLHKVPNVVGLVTTGVVHCGLLVVLLRHYGVSCMDQEWKKKWVG